MSRTWTPAEETELRRLYKAGVEYNDIASKLNRTKSAIRDKTHKLNIRTRRRMWTRSEDRLVARMDIGDEAAIRAIMPTLKRSYKAIYQHMITLQNSDKYTKIPAVGEDGWWLYKNCK